MENRIKIAADSLLKKGNITREEHGELCKVAFKFKTFMDSLKTVGKKLPDHAEIINILKPIAYLGAIGVGGKELIVDPLVEKNKINQSNIATQLTPLNRQAASNLKLQSPYQYQFEGGKKTGLTETTTPHTF